MKHINDTFEYIVLLLLIASIAFMVAKPLKACEFGKAYNYDSKKCEKIDTSLNPKWVEFYGVADTNETINVLVEGK